MSDDPAAAPHGAGGDDHDGVEHDREEPEEDAGGITWPVKGPATAQQAIVAIAFIFFLGVAIGFALARTF